MLKRAIVVFFVMSLLLFSNIAVANEDHNGHDSYITTVSWYNRGYKTANGEKFNANGFTVAHKHLPFGTIVKITSLETGKVVFARVNDRGPFYKNREFDLSEGCAKVLEMRKAGVIKVRIEILS